MTKTAAGIQKFAGILCGRSCRLPASTEEVVLLWRCAQNVTFNSKLFQLFEDVHIAVSPTDAGSSLGTAAMSWAKATGKDRLVWSPMQDIT